MSLGWPRTRRAQPSVAAATALGELAQVAGIAGGLVAVAILFKVFGPLVWEFGAAFLALWLVEKIREFIVREFRRSRWMRRHPDYYVFPIRRSDLPFREGQLPDIQHLATRSNEMAWAIRTARIAVLARIYQWESRAARMIIRAVKITVSG